MLRTLQIFDLLMYICLILSSFLYSVPSSLLLSDFSDNCPLFMHGYWESRPNETFFRVTNNWGPAGACKLNKVLGYSGLGVGILFTLTTAYAIHFRKDRGWLSSFVMLTLSSLASIVLLSLAWVFSAGFNNFCYLATHGFSGPPCKAMQSTPFFDPYHHVRNDRFYGLMICIQIGLISSLVLWLGQAISSALVLYVHTEREAFLVTLQRERDNLMRHVFRQQNYDPL